MAEGVRGGVESGTGGAEEGLYGEEEWGRVRKSIVRQYIESERETLVGDQLLIQAQNELLEEIRQKVRRARVKESLGSLEVLPIDSSLSNISSHYNYLDDESFLKNKFTEEFELSLVNSALREVRGSCSEETYETVRNYVANNKQKECESLAKSLERRNKEAEQLSLAVIMKQNELARLREEVAPYVSKAEFFDEEKRRWRKKNDQLMEKELILHKMERAFIFKEKMHQEAKKRAEDLKVFTDGLYSKMARIEQDLDSLRRHIEAQMAAAQSRPCCQQSPVPCWKKEVLQKFREKLLEERALLKEEERHLEKRYQSLESVSQQCKKLVSDSYEGLVSGGSGVSGREEKSERVISMSLIASSDRKR